MVDPDPVWDAFAALLPSPGPSTDPDLGGGRSATQFTRCPWICGRAISRHPVGGASRVVAGSVETSQLVVSRSASSSKLSQLACIRAVMSCDPDSKNRPCVSQDKQVTSPAWPALAGAGAHLALQFSVVSNLRHACSAPPCACASIRFALLSNIAP